MIQPKLVVLDMKRAIDTFRSCVMEVFIEDDFLIHILTQFMHNLQDWNIGDLFIREMCEYIIKVYGYEEKSGEADALLRGSIQLFHDLVLEIEKHNMAKGDTLFYEFGSLYNGAVVIQSTL